MVPIFSHHSRMAFLTCHWFAKYLHLSAPEVEQNDFKSLFTCLSPGLWLSDAQIIAMQKMWHIPVLQKMLTKKWFKNHILFCVLWSVETYYAETFMCTCYHEGNMLPYLTLCCVMPLQIYYVRSIIMQCIWIPIFIQIRVVNTIMFCHKTTLCKHFLFLYQ